MRGWILCGIATLLVLTPSANALPELAHACDGTLAVGVYISDSIPIECGRDCDHVVVTFGVGIVSNNELCTGCSDNLLNIGVALAGDNRQCYGA